MPRTLFARLSLVLLALFLVIGVVQVAVTLVTTRLYQQEVAQKLNRDLARHLTDEKILMRNGRIDEGALKEVFHMLMVINPSIEIYLLDPDGKILAFSAPPGKVERSHVSLTPVRQFLSSETRYPILGEDPRSRERRKVFSAAPLLSESGTLQGYLYVILGGEEYDSVAQRLRGSLILRLSALAAVGALLIGLVLALLLFRLLTRRLRKLGRGIETFRRSGFTEPIGLPDVDRDGDEIEHLAASFREMSERIIQQLDELKRNDTLRRELIANVSHDLRTPLAALHGYIETLLLKQDTLQPEDRRRYLEIASRHGERLGKLIEELFELSKLEANETKPQLERCSMAELAQDVVQRFQIAADKKEVHLQADVRPDLPDARVDIRLMERVLQNLIENSIHHTPAGGKVVVKADLDSMGGLLVEVSDSGAGIAPEEMPFIFERYYRGNKAAGIAGTGLGLAIARRIVELHGSTLNVRSDHRSGTTVSFAPPLLATGPDVTKT